MKKDIKSHPLADIFPLMPASDIKELSDDIKERGLQNPIVLFEGKILDGRHRYEACEQAGVKPKFVEYKGTDPVGCVIAANIKRRHLTVSQKAMVAATIADLPRGGDRKSDVQNQSANLRPTHENIADLLAISARTVDRASKIKNESPALAKKVRDGKISLNEASKQVAEEAKQVAAEANQDEPERKKDSIGRVIPHDVLPDWERAVSVSKHLQALASEIKVTVERGLQAQDIIFAEVFNHTIAEASALHFQLRQIVPYSVCPMCQGKVKNKCLLCKGRGWISKFLWESPSVMPETRAMILKLVSKGTP